VNTWKIILATMVIFGAGVVTGGLLVRNSERVRPARPVRSASAARSVQAVSPGNMRLDFLRRMERELDLEPDQHQRIDAILKESQERSRKLMEPVSPALRQELQRAREEFRSVLTPGQRARFDELVKQRRQPHSPESSPVSERSSNIPAR
jgi:Spy/CpxP family protein refolding chaperone